MKKTIGILTAAFIALTLAAMPSQADTYKPAETKAGTDIVFADKMLSSLDSSGYLHFYRLTVLDNYYWRHIVQDGQMFIRPLTSKVILYRDGWDPYAGIVGHHNDARSYFFPLGSNALAYKTTSLDWGGSPVADHLNVWVSYKEQNATTRWLKDKISVTVRLPANETFYCGCVKNKPAWSGKRTYTFYLYTAYLK